MQFRIWSQESVNVNIDFDPEHAEHMEPRPPVKVEIALPADAMHGLSTSRYSGRKSRSTEVWT